MVRQIDAGGIMPTVAADWMRVVIFNWVSS